MPRKIAVRVSTFMLCLGVLLWSGCVGYLKPEIGALARKESRISLAADIPAGVFETENLRVNYSLAQKGEALTLTGKIVIDRSVTDSFPVITQFFLYLSFLDDTGKVLETVDVSPVFNTYGAVPDSMPLSVSRVRPPGSKAVAFHYVGRFRANPVNEGGQWEITYFPFN